MHNFHRITGDDRWSYENVLKFFKKSEDYVGDWDDPKYHSHGGLLSVTKAPFQGLCMHKYETICSNRIAQYM